MIRYQSREWMASGGVRGLQNRAARICNRSETINRHNQRPIEIVTFPLRAPPGAMRFRVAAASLQRMNDPP